MRPDDRDLQELLEAWDAMPDKSRVHMVGVARALASGFTGTIRLECRDGGVGDHFHNHTMQPDRIRSEYNGTPEG